MFLLPPSRRLRLPGSFNQRQSFPRAGVQLGCRGHGGGQTAAKGDVHSPEGWRRWPGCRGWWLAVRTYSARPCLLRCWVVAPKEDSRQPLLRNSSPVMQIAPSTPHPPRGLSVLPPASCVSALLESRGLPNPLRYWAEASHQTPSPPQTHTHTHTHTRAFSLTTPAWPTEPPGAASSISGYMRPRGKRCKQLSVRGKGQAGLCSIGVLRMHRLCQKLHLCWTWQWTKLATQTRFLPSESFPASSRSPCCS